MENSEEMSESEREIMLKLLKECDESDSDDEGYDADLSESDSDISVGSESGFFDGEGDEPFMDLARAGVGAHDDVGVDDGDDVEVHDDEVDVVNFTDSDGFVRSVNECSAPPPRDTQPEPRNYVFMTQPFNEQQYWLNNYLPELEPELNLGYRWDAYKRYHCEEQCTCPRWADNDLSLGRRYDGNYDERNPEGQLRSGQRIRLPSESNVSSDSDRMAISSDEFSPPPTSNADGSESDTAQAPNRQEAAVPVTNTPENYYNSQGEEDRLSSDLDELIVSNTETTIDPNSPTGFLTNFIPQHQEFSAADFNGPVYSDDYWNILEEQFAEEEMDSDD